MRSKTPKSRRGRLGRPSECADSRRRLEKATTEYFESLPHDALAEQSSIAVALSRAAENIDIHGLTE